MHYFYSKKKTDTCKKQFSAFACARVTYFCNALFVFSDGVLYVYLLAFLFIHFLDFKKFTQEKSKHCGAFQYNYLHNITSDKVSISRLQDQCQGR